MKGRAAALCIVLAFLCAGCAKKSVAPQNTGGKITVTAAIFPPYDFSRAIAGDRINLLMLLPPAAESHSFEPSPKDIIALRNSDIFIRIGGESEAWVDRMLQSIDAGGMKIIRLMDSVEVVEEEIIEGMEDGAEAEEGPEGGVYDEHIWTSPKNAGRMVWAILGGLCEKDPANAPYYRQNAEAYIAKLRELDAAFQSAADQAKRKTIVFGDRFPFRYLADAYGLTCFAAFPGCSTETEPSAATVAFLIAKIKEEKIPVVFHLELSNEKMADAIAEETGAKKRLLHSVHNISKRDFDRGATYLELMAGNAAALREALR
ncbi:MAG: metal ABC transporter substrate-binding protein [Treponema sp.]|nr:metal ABC transporter substrate-binding protein [Treponema sp.]